MWKTLGISVLGIVTATGAFVAWFFSLIEPTAAAGLQKATPEDLPYYQQRVAEHRGRVLIVVTSETEMGDSGKPTGYELTELSRAYYVFTVNGFEVDIASPLGGAARAVIDDEDMGPLDYAFLNDPDAMARAEDTLPLASVDGNDYRATFFVGGKGTMWDFPDNPYIHQLVRDYADKGKLLGAVCHGPAALANVMLDNGRPFLAGKPVTGFSNEEELLLIPEAGELFPFLLEDRMREQGAEVVVGTPYLENVAVSAGLVTGQNPWSVYATAEAMVSQLGYAPVPRRATGIENSVDVLLQYHLLGKVGAREAMDALVNAGEDLNRNLIIMHGLLAVMRWRLKSGLELLVLAQHAKTISGR
ncbi:type 1 glutamine amidotransferase domain-containing protein [Seongchinamella sediminis]|uniref:Type 1 glutamine amidotransferase domain-containing protein n=1 Tax=Seongchinamella sediminis TaxID=2283635 RepID=A0A3L7DWN9_9GAMM|nr:type 1 glutamine amidotransferase domain-containing protein [Seongchinamella sediminis]RLQ21998.1 type 1 glutamine amidotransferase domain-containing protein [Seongchinamella sediminis]